MGTKRSFRDPETGVLKAWGYVEANEPGDLSRIEADDFFLDPGQWVLVGDDWRANEEAAEEA